jgi:small subunit ribosomal protein S14
MSKKSTLQREIKKREIAYHYNEKRLLLLHEYSNSLKHLYSQKPPLNTNDTEFSDKSLNWGEIQKLRTKLERLPRNSSFSRRRNRCWATGRSRGIYRDVGLARQQFRKQALSGAFEGITKA